MLGIGLVVGGYFAWKKHQENEAAAAVAAAEQKKLEEEAAAQKKKIEELEAEKAKETEKIEKRLAKAKIPVPEVNPVKPVMQAYADAGMRAWAVRTTERVIGLVSKGLARFLATKVSDVADGLKTLADPRLAFGFVLETTLYWASNAVGMWILAQGCGLELSLGQAVGVMGILAIGILLPAGPGLFGSFQLAVSLALQLFFANEIVTGVGAVYVFLLFTIQAVGIVLAGVMLIQKLRGRPA